MTILADKPVYKSYPDEPTCPAWTLRQIIESWLRSWAFMNAWDAEEKAKEIIAQIESKSE